MESSLIPCTLALNNFAKAFMLTLVVFYKMNSSFVKNVAAVFPASEKSIDKDSTGRSKKRTAEIFRRQLLQNLIGNEYSKFTYRMVSLKRNLTCFHTKVRLTTRFIN